MLEREGKLEIDKAESLAEAHAFLDQLQQLHQSHWVSKGAAGSFANAFFCKFHRRLVDRAFPEGSVQLLRTRAGNQAFGYLYNLVHNGHVLNYQTGFDYSRGIRDHRPGIVAHSLAIDFNYHANRKVYDFLAGDAQYKRQLATQSHEMQWMSVRRSTLSVRAVDALRSLKSSLTRLNRRIRRRA